LRFIHAKVVERSSQALFFAKVARTEELAQNLRREILLSKKALSLPRGIRLLTPIKVLGDDTFLYEYLPDKRLSDHVDRRGGEIEPVALRRFCKLAVDFSYYQRQIDFRPSEMFLEIRLFERQLLDKATRSPIYRRAEVLKSYARLNQRPASYYYEIGDFQLQNLAFFGRPRTLILFDLEAWSLFRGNWSLASLFTITWFRHAGEEISKELYRSFLRHTKTSSHEHSEFLLCCLYFIFIYYPSYSRRSARYKRNFDSLIDWLLNAVESYAA
jgi:hypothetical protein